MKKTAFTILLLGYLTAGCKYPLIEEHGHYVEISPNSSLTINKEVIVYPGHARAYFQNGRLIEPSGLNYYQVNCELEVQQVKNVKQFIQPGHFDIIRVFQDESPIVLLEAPLSVASLDMVFFDDDSPVDTKRFWKFALSSKTQPDVRALICRGAQDTPYLAKLPTLNEIKEALGAYIEIQIR